MQTCPRTVDHAKPAALQGQVSDDLHWLTLARRAAAVDSPASLQSWWEEGAGRGWPGSALVVWSLEVGGPGSPALWLRGNGIDERRWQAWIEPAWGRSLGRQVYQAWHAAGERPCRLDLCPPSSWCEARWPLLVHGLRARRVYAVIPLGPLTGSGEPVPAGALHDPLSTLEWLAPVLEVACAGAGAGAGGPTLPVRAPQPAAASARMATPTLASWAGAWPAPASEPITVARAPGSVLSLRERQIMAWVAQGKTNPEIGCILRISEFTVKNHLKSIFSKLDVTNRAQAVARLSRLAPQA
jgi:DNA-binding CsgD family transcriptional regulator